MEWNQRAFVTIAKPLCARGVDRNAKECQIKMKTLKIASTSRPLFAYNQAAHPYKSNAANSCCFVRIRLRTNRAGAVWKSYVHQLIIWAAPSEKLRIEGTLTEAAASWRFLPVIDFPHPHLPAGAGFDSATLHSQVCWIVKKKKDSNSPRSDSCCAALPFRAPVVVVALDGCCGFLEADVVESSKGRAADVFDSVVGDEELLLRRVGDGEGSSEANYCKIRSGSIWAAPYLPPHENIVRVLQILIVEIIRVERLCILVEGLELALDTKNKRITSRQSILL